MWTQVVEISKLQKPNFTILCCGWLAGCRGWFIDAVLCNSKCHRIMGLKYLWNFIQFLFTRPRIWHHGLIKIFYRPLFWETSTNVSFTTPTSKYHHVLPDWFIDRFYPQIGFWTTILLWQVNWVKYIWRKKKIQSPSMRENGYFCYWICDFPQN